MPCINKYVNLCSQLLHSDGWHMKEIESGERKSRGLGCVSHRKLRKGDRLGTAGVSERQKRHCDLNTRVSYRFQRWTAPPILVFLRPKTCGIQKSARPESKVKPLP